MLSAKTFPGIQQRTEPLPACPGTLQAQGVPRGTLKTPQEAGALNNPAPKEPPRSGSGLLPCSQWPHQTTRVSKLEGGILWLGGQLRGPLLWLQVGGWGQQKEQSLRLQRTRPPASPSLPPSREEIFRAPVVLKGGGTGRDTEHSGSVKDSAELCLNSSRMVLLGPLSPQTSEQTAFSATDSHKPF